jgi:predicted lipase
MRLIDQSSSSCGHALKAFGLFTSALRLKRSHHAVRQVFQLLVAYFLKMPW